MVELGDIIDMIWVDDSKSCYIFREDGEVFDYFDDDFSDEMSSIVSSIDIYADKVEIYLGE